MLYVVYLIYMVATYRIIDLLGDTKYRSLQFPVLFVCSLAPAFFISPGSLSFLLMVGLVFLAMILNIVIRAISRTNEKIRTITVIAIPPGMEAEKLVIERLLNGEKDLWKDLHEFLSWKLSTNPFVTSKDQEKLNETFGIILDQIEKEHLRAKALMGISRYWPQFLREFVEVHKK